MRLTKQTSYAVRILVECALAEGGLIKMAQIAQRYQIAEHNLAKTLPPLVKAGFVKSVRGRKGGICLALPPGEIRLGDMVKTIETTNVETDCTGAGPVECAIRPAAPMNRILDEALEAFIDVLNEHTLADLMHGRENIPGLGGLGSEREAEDRQDARAQDRGDGPRPHNRPG